MKTQLKLFRVENKNDGELYFLVLAENESQAEREVIANHLINNYFIAVRDVTKFIYKEVMGAVSYLDSERLALTYQIAGRENHGIYAAEPTVVTCHTKFAC